MLEKTSAGREVATNLTARATRYAGIACLAGALTGCASPIVSVQRPIVADVPDYTLSYGITYANKARDAYQAAIQREVTTSNTLSSGLIGLGAVIAGLAAFGAHRDVLIGAGLVGGTAFALGQWNLNRQRLLIYQAGVEGMNCAVRAVTPLYIGPAEFAALAKAVGDLEVKISDTVSASEELRRQIAALAAGNEARQLAEAEINEANARIERARTIVASARQFMVAVRRAGPELVGAVDRIGATVDKAVLDTIPDLSAVPKVVGGLAGLAASFAPGAGLDTTISGALAGFAPKSGTGAQSAAVVDAMPAGYKNAYNALVLRSRELANTTAVVQALLAGHDTTANTDRLKDCGVTGIDAPLKVDPQRLEFKTGADTTKRVILSGGASAVYSCAFVNDPPEGLTVKSPLSGERTCQVTAKGVKQTDSVPLLVTDAAGKQARVDVVVIDGGKQAPAPAVPGAGAGAADKEIVKQQLIDRLTEIKSVKKGNDEFAFGTFTRGDNRVEVAVTCPGSGAKADSGELLAELMKTQSNDPAIKAATANQIAIAFSGTCITGTGAQGALVVDPPLARLSLKPAQVARIQRNLCIPAREAKGHWGNKTSYELALWRMRRGDPGTRSPETLREDELDALLRPSASELRRCGR